MLDIILFIFMDDKTLYSYPSLFIIITIYNLYNCNLQICHVQIIDIPIHIHTNTHTLIDFTL